jgi:methanogenic corrinoid protein MtbC1
MVQVIDFLVTAAIVEHHVEGAADSHDDLLARAMSMATTTPATRNIIGPIDARDIKRNMAHLLCHRQVTARVNDLG